MKTHSMFNWKIVMSVSIISLSIFFFKPVYADPFPGHMSYNFDDNQVPAGWILTTSGDAGISNGHLYANPNGYANLSIVGTSPPETDSIIIQYDLDAFDYNERVIRGINVRVPHDTIHVDIGKSDTILTPYIMLNSDLEPLWLELLPITNHEYIRITIIIRDSHIRYKVFSINYQHLWMDHAIVVPQLSLGNIAEIDALVQASPDGNCWMDNLAIDFNGTCVFVLGDVNGDCRSNGLDVVYYVAYLKGGPALVRRCDCY